MYDILVVGGGPAGLTAALYAARAGKSVAVLEQAAPGGQIINAPLVENYPALPHVSGADFAEALQNQAEALGVELLYEEAVRAEKIGPGFRVTTDGGAHDCRALVLAPGVRHRCLGLEGEEELTGNGLSYCAVCDGAFYAGKDVAVVGGGDTALQDALFLAGLCRSVRVLVRRDRFRGEALRARQLMARENVTVLFQTTVEGLERDGAGNLRGLVLRREGRETALPVEGLFLAVGQEPNTAAFAPLVELDGDGYILAGEDTATGVPGVFAAGDARQKAVRQLATAVGDGAAAALAACRWLD
ncbi:MAG: FAD-dependent oxidoreductase [Oscillospiraceae bacterium]|nr:FAD-dependent oxidoreductase [Oscillospiraceae bacterium]